MSEKIYTVLFLCTGNSARSILAETILNHLGGGKVRAFSAGSQPKGAVHPFAIEVLKSMNHETDNLRSKSWDEFSSPLAPKFDIILTVCDNAAAETCPIWPSHPMTAHWGIPDPAAVEGSEAERRAAFDDAYGRLHHRISVFLSLPLASMDRQSLKSKLNKIGMPSR